MACTYTVNGREMSDKEFKRYLSVELDSQAKDSLSLKLFNDHNLVYRTMNPSGLRLNSDQQRAMYSFQRFMKGKDTYFTLDGAAGVGKTEVIKSMYEIATSQGKKVAALAISHRAKMNISEVPKSDKYTVASFNAKIRNLMREFEQSKSAIPKALYYNLVIIDESSMVDMTEIALMIQANPKINIVMVGDSNQILPIKRKEDKVMLLSQGPNYVKLNEIVRQKEGNPIIELGSSFVENISNKGKRSPSEVIDDFGRESRFDSETQEGVIFSDSEEQMLAMFINEVKNNPDPLLSRIVTYNSHTYADINKNIPLSMSSVNRVNRIVMKALFGDSNPYVLHNNQIITIYEKSMMFGLENSENLVIQDFEELGMFDITKVRSKSWGSNQMKTYADVLKEIGQENMINQVQKMRVNAINEENALKTFETVHHDDRDAYNNMIDKLTKHRKDFVRNFATRIQDQLVEYQPGYAITSHKAQGSTYRNTYIMEDNISQPASKYPGKSEEMNRIFYTALTRSSKKTYILGLRSEPDIMELQEIGPLGDQFAGDINNNPILGGLELQLRNARRSLKGLESDRATSDSMTEKKRLAKIIVSKKNQINSLYERIESFQDDISSGALVEEGNQVLAQLRSYVAKNRDLGEREHMEMSKLAKAWSEVSDLYTELWSSPSDEVTKELAFIEREIRNLRIDMDDILMRKVLDHMNQNLVEDYTIDDVKSIDRDPDWLKRYFSDLTMANSPLLQSADITMETARQQTSDYLKTVLETVKILDDAKDEALSALGLDENIYRQKDNRGVYTGFLINPYTQEFLDKKFNLENAVISAQSTNEKRKAYKDLNDFLSTNTHYMDISSIVSKEGMALSSNVEEVASDLIKEYGETYAKRYLKKQKSLLDDYHVDLEMEIESLSELISNKEDLQSAIKIWKVQNSPYYFTNSSTRWITKEQLLEMGASEEVIERYGLDKGMRMNGGNYLIELPNLIGEDGNPTVWANSDFAIIQENESLLNFYTYVSDKLEEMREMSPNLSKRRLEDGAIPFSNQLMLQYLNELGAISKVGQYQRDNFIRLMRDDMKGYAKDLFNPEENRRIKETYVMTESMAMGKELERITSDFIVVNDRKPNEQEAKALEDEASDTVINLNRPKLKDVLYSHAATTATYHFRNNVEDILNMIENASKNLIDLSRTQDNKDPVLAKNAAGMLGHFLNIFYMVKNEKGQEFGEKKIFTFGEKKLMEDLQKEIAESNEYLLDLENRRGDLNDQLKAGQISAEEYRLLSSDLESNQKSVSETTAEREKRLEKIGSKKTYSGMIEAAAHVYHVKTLGWKFSSGIMNFLYGITSNFVESGANVFFTQKQMFSAYRLVVNSVGKNFGMSSPNGRKVANIMFNWDILKEMHLDMETIKEKNTDGFFKRYSAPYEIMSSTEYINQAPVAVAVLMNHKVEHKETGEMVNAWEAMDEEGQWMEEYIRPSNDEIKKIRIRIDTAIRQIHGNYDPFRNPEIRSTTGGRLVSMFRRWIFNGVTTRFGADWTNHQIGVQFRGRYRSYGAGAGILGALAYGSIYSTPVGAVLGVASMFAGRMFSAKDRFQEGEEMSAFGELFFTTKQLIKKMMFQKTSFDSVYREVDAQNMRRNLNEIMVILVMIAIKHTLGAIKDLLDDDEDGAQGNMFITNLADRAIKEIGFFIDPNTVMEISKQAVPLFSAVVDAQKLVEAASKTAFGDGTIETGPYVGQNRLWRQLKRNIPFLNNFYTLETWSKTNL